MCRLNTPACIFRFASKIVTRDILNGVFIGLMTVSAFAQEIDLTEVKSILDNRCTVCHGCYDAPCQLKFSAFDGLLRGASKTPIYNQSRTTAIAPTRLFVDANSVSEWRDLGFFSVVESQTGSARSILEQILNLKSKFSVQDGVQLPADFPLDINRELNCPAPEEFSSFAEEHPQFGMPYGMAPLPSDEFSLIERWANQGFPNVDEQVNAEPSFNEEIEQWESYLNAPGAQQVLLSRYLFEHLYLGHLTFDEHSSNRYFRMIRSYTPPGIYPVEIATLHPNDDPGIAEFYYRLIPVTETSLDKTHFSYSMDLSRLEKIKNLFAPESWSVSELPSYTDKEATNPFLTFQDIPARSRYEFLLDDAFYFISNFIKGPVCRGQVALNVIPDHFFVAFLDPDYDLSVIDPDYLGTGKDFLALPSREALPQEHLQIWMDRLGAHQDYLEHRDNAYRSHAVTKEGFPFGAIWQGFEEDDDNLLTVFRHFDSATVVNDLIGATPNRVWVLDYPILERIYYDLVVNFDVFGNLSHQLLTRLYMDYLRMESEGLFLAFLPTGSREVLLEQWYRGMTAQIKIFWAHSNLLFNIPTQINFTTGSYLEEFITLVRQSDGSPSHLQNLNSAETLAHAQLQTLDNNIAVSHEWVNFLPELSYVLIYDDTDNLETVATLLRNKAHSNISFVFFEEDRRIPQEDTTTFTFGTLGSYPNFFFKVSLDEVEQFVIALRSVVDQDSLIEVVEQFGIRRTDRRIWSTLDDLHEWRRQQSGRNDLLDMNRYANL